MMIVNVARPSWLAVATLLAASCVSASDSPDLTGVWQVENYSAQLRPGDGSPLPLTPQSKELLAKNQASLKKGDLHFDLTALQCSSPGAVRMMTLPNPIEFFQRPQQLTLLFEWNHLYRLINLREQPRVPPYPLAIGVSNGRWEGSTLVVETTGLADNTLLDSAGLPHSDQLRVTERFRLIDDGKRLENAMTLHDPQTFTRDWSVTLTYRKTGAKGVEEDVCLDRKDAGKPAISPH